MMIALIPALAAVLGLFATRSALAQTLEQHSFAFKFAGSNQDLEQCGTYALATILVNSTSTFYGTPPYTIWAFEAGGLSDRQDGGSNSTNIPWQVRHPPGARIWLTITDADDNIAGFPDYLTILNGTSDCMPQIADNLPVITGNVSETTLNTCENWGLNITGGTPPYSILILADDSPVYTNITAPDTQENYYTWPNRADPGRSMIVAVSDATGALGYSTQPVTTHGSTNTSCPGTLSSWHQWSLVKELLAEEAKAAQAAKAAQKRTIIVAVVVSVVGFVLLGVLSFYLWRRGVNTRAGVRKGQPGFDMEPVVAYFPPPAAAGQQEPQHMVQTQTQPDLTMTPFTTSNHLLSRQASMFSANSSYSQRDELPPLPVPDFDPYTLVGATPANRKAAEAASERRAALARGQSVSSQSGQGSYYQYSMPGTPAYPDHSVSADSSGLRRGPSSVGGSGQSAPSVVGTDDDGAIIVQHRDGGIPQPIVFELPPSYDPGSYRRPPSGVPGAMQPPREKR